MAEETVTDRARGLLLKSDWFPLGALLTWKHGAVVTLGFAVSAFLVYYLLGPRETPYSNFVLLADRLLHGHVDLKEDITYLELSVRNGKFYVIPPPWPAIIVLPGVALFGVALNQTLVSTVIGAINASVVHRITRGVTERLSAHIWLTALFMLGTIYWYAASNGGVWYFSHTVAVLFLFLAIYVTVVDKRPLWAGLFLGAAFWSRQPTILALPFFLIMFSDQWLPESRKQETSLLKRVDLKPLILLGVGLGVFIALSFVYNYLRFETPLDASQNFRKPEILREPWFNHGPFHYSYVERHVPVFFESMPIVKSTAPYVIPSFSGMAMWSTTPAFFYALFYGIRSKLIIALAAALLFIAVAIVISRAVAAAWELDWATQEFPLRANVWPFYLLIALAVYFGRKDKLVLACWSAILPITLMLFTFAGTGFAQFGYRFSLDFLPFLFLLTVKAMGDDLKWHHKLLIVTSIAINLWGVLWIYQFDPHQFLDLRWVAS